MAAADAPAVVADRYPDSPLLLLTVRREQLLETDLPDEIAAELNDLDASLVSLMIRLALRMWERKDVGAVDTITTCIVDLPTAVLLRRNRLNSTIAREQLRAAVTAVLDIGPPPERATP